jgi:DNA-binding MarR family transcriptional regulator
MVLLSMEPGLPISVLATSIGLSHAGTVRLIDRLEREQLVERRRQITDRRARFIHLTNSGKKITDALLKAREQVISECISPLSPNDLDILVAGDN